jgi:hypothetical protein
MRCTFRQTKPKNPRINPYASVKCRAKGGFRVYFEGYA